MSWIKQNKFKVLVIAGILTVILLIVFKVGRHAPAEESSHLRPTVDVSAAYVQSMEAPILHESPGTVRPKTESDVAAKIMSTVSAVYVREGDHVSAGQVLIRLESADLSAQEAQASAELKASKSRVSTAYTTAQLQKAQSSAGVSTARSALEAAREQLKLAQSGPRRQERSQAQLAVIQAEAQARNAEADYNRMKRLFDQDVIPKQRLDSAQTAYEVAKAQLDAAKEQSNMVEEGSRQEDIRTAQAKVRQAEEALKLAQASVAQNKIRADEARTASADADRASASLRYARVTKDYAIIRAPISGLVTRRMTDPGDMVQPGMPLITVEESKDYRLEVTVPEESARSLYKGKQVNVKIDATSSEWVPTRVTQIIPAADRNSRSFTVKVNIPAGIRVRSGEFGRLQFDTGKERGLFIPQAAIVSRNGLTGVFTIDDKEIARYRLVKVNKPSHSMVHVLAGVSDGDKVIISDTSSLEDGTPVRSKE
ncbi:MAG: efflux RND transporter periplasmic adaptor subunit [Armatimonadota bacterium]